MKVNSRLIALMVAMAAGTAAAAGTATQAGTAIKNVASATFTDPTTGVAVVNPVLSNEVTTTVTPVVGFDINYKGNLTDDNTASTPVTAYDIANVAATSSTQTIYTVVNNSNVNGYVVNFTADTTGSAIPDTNAKFTSVKYYPAGTTSFVPANEITSVTLSDTGTGSTKDIIQVITIDKAAAGDKFSASPKGTAPASTDTTAYPTIPVVRNGVTTFDPAKGSFAEVKEADNKNGSPAAANVNGDLEYTRVTVATAVVTLQPPTDTDPSTPAVDPPKSGTVPGVTGPTVTNPNTYTPPTNTGVTNTPGTIITVVTTPGITLGDQVAYPKSDVDPVVAGSPVYTSDVVTFVSQVKNGGPVDDVMKIKIPTTGLPAGTTIKVLDKDGNVLTPDGTGLYTLPGGPVAPGGSVPFQVVVTYPDSDKSADIVVVPVQVFSSNVPSTTPLDTGTLTIYPPQMKFGDTVGSAPTGTPDATKTPTETVAPGGATNVTPGTTTDASAVFPMSVLNSGTYAETYTLTATDIVFKDVNGNDLPAVPVKYYTAAGVALTAGVTGVIDPGKSADFYAVVNVPAGAVATTGAYIATPTTANPFPQPQVLQTATGNISGDTATDKNDEIKVAVVNTNPDPVTGNPTSGIDVDKYQAINATVPTPPTPADKANKTAVPTDTVRYAIVAKNNFNTPVKNFVLSDSAAGQNVYTFSKFVSATATVTPVTGFTGFVVAAPITSATVYYKWTGTLAGAAVTSGGFVTAAPTATNMDTVTTLDVAVDTNGDSAITAADIVPANASIRLNIVVTVK